ncbi:hypothetical protein QR680_000289 [Steinernema hermaphroditum]|uniref:Uncharacterized protein n=1 Tax=Steinernema hermaphroditum TaxID=289476 RepID=A0AA39GWU3_9BILA|nr:hypothetical protein QR680_000289 [Steinernema hermaphroditum]
MCNAVKTCLHDNESKDPRGRVARVLTRCKTGKADHGSGSCTRRARRAPQHEPTAKQAGTGGVEYIDQRPGGDERRRGNQVRDKVILASTSMFGMSVARA